MTPEIAKGARVRLNRAAIEALPPYARPRAHSRAGLVVGAGRNPARLSWEPMARPARCIIVLFDGLKTRQRWHPDLLEVLPC